MAAPSNASESFEEAQRIAEKVVNALGGYGIFGVEFFVQGDNVYFSELSPRPHDTGMVTMISQDLSEFALHVTRYSWCADSLHPATRSFGVISDPGKRKF